MLITSINAIWQNVISPPLLDTPQVPYMKDLKCTHRLVPSYSISGTLTISTESLDVILFDKTEVIAMSRNKRRLVMLEALLIKENKPSLNSQAEGRDRLLKIFIFKIAYPRFDMDLVL